MINSDPNMSRKQILQELPIPEKADVTTHGSKLVYKAVFIAVKLLLDIRLNLVKISEGKRIKTNYKKLTNEYTGGKIIKHTKVDNAVIKEKDTIK